MGCGNRRREQLRHYEVGLRLNASGGRWTILCHNCAATAETYQPAPRSVDALCQKLARDRRWSDRRYNRTYRPPSFERRDQDHANERRLDLRDIFDATDLAEELVIEMEAELEASDDMTGIHVMATSDENETLGLPSDELFK